MRNHTTILTLAAACCATLLLLTRAAVSQELPPDCPERPVDGDSATALANTWFKKAEAAYAEKRYGEAVRAFRCSLRMVEHPATYYNAAQAALMAEDKPSALEFFRRNLELAPDGKSAAEVELEIADLEQELEPSAPAQPMTGPSTADEEQPEAEPEAEPEPEPEPEPGPDLAAGPNGVKVAGIVLAAVGAAGAVTGAVLQGMAGKAKTDSEEAEWLADFRDAEDRMSSFQKGAYVGFFVGGALLVTGVIMIAVDGDDEASDGAEVAVTPAPSGIVLTGRF